MTKLYALALMSAFVLSSIVLRSSTMNLQATLSSGYWPLEKSQPLIDKTQTIRLNPDLTKLSGGERMAVQKLLSVGEIFQKLYEKQRHPEAVSSYQTLEELDKKNGSKP